MHYAYVYTKHALNGDPYIDVVQCDRSQVPTEIEDADVAVPLMTQLTEALLQRAAKLKLILQYGAGVEGVDIAAASGLGIWVSNIPSRDTGNAQSCAEMAIFLTLAILRNLNGMTRSIKQQQLGVPPGDALIGKSVLVIGFGNIAKELIVRLVPFKVKIAALRRSDHWGKHKDLLSSAAESALLDRGVWPQDMHRLASAADIIIITCKQDSENVEMINADFLSHCKHGVRVVNVARGGLMRYNDILEGLGSGKIGGLGLDVQFWEPFDPDDPVAQHEAVVLTPHVAGVTHQSCEFVCMV